MMKSIRSILVTVVTLFAISCEQDFIEDDLRGKRVSIIAPANADTVSSSSPLFWWNEIGGALKYRVQIVYPDFATPQQLLYDTAVSGDRFYPSLQPGYTYAWRIRPENGSSVGDWVQRQLTVDSSASLSTQNVLITTPQNNGYSTSSSLVSFTWNALTGATLYRIDITNTTSGLVVTTLSTTTTAYTAVLQQGSYTFRVRGENAVSFTPWAARTFSIDQTAPTVPQLITPAANAFYATPPATLVFDWNNDATAFSDSLWIGTDSTFAGGILIQQLLLSTQSTYSWTGAQAATTYYWRVRSTDAAGNLSNYSSVFRFTVN